MILSTAKKIAVNSAMILFGRLVSKILGLATIMILARYLGVELFGQYSLVITFCGFFLYFNDLGVYSVVLRRISQGNDDPSELVSNAMLVKIIFSFLAIFLVVAAGFFLGYPLELIVLFFVYSMTLLTSSITGLFNGFFQAKLLNKYVIFSELITSIAFFLLLLILIFLKQSLFFIIAAFLFSTIIALLTSFYFVRKFLKITLLPKKKNLTRFFAEGYPFALTQILSGLYYRIDVVIISKLLNNYALGLYSAAFRLTESLTIIQGAFVQPLFPIMSSLFKNSSKNLEVSYNLGLRYMVYLVLPIAIGGAMLAQKIIFIVYGAEFADPSVYLSFIILLWGALVMLVNQISITTLNSSLNEKKVVKIYFIGLFANVLLNFFLVPVFGIVGAALSTLIAEIILFLFLYFLLKKELHIDFSWIVKVVVACIIMAFFANLIIGQNTILIVLFSAIIYFASLYLVKGFTTQDREIFKKIVGMNN